LVITAGYHGALPEEDRDGIHIVRMPSWTLPETRISFNFDITFALRWGNRKRVFALLDRFQPDVIHQHGQFFDLTWTAGLWARLRKVPSLLTLHTRLISPMWVPNLVFRGLDAMVVRPILDYIRPTKVLAIDVVFYEYIKARYGIGDDRIETSAVGVELDRFHDLDPVAERKALRERFDIGDGPLIASLGHVIPIRNRIGLIEALPRVLKRHPDTKVLVVGGVYYGRFQERAKELGVEHAVICTGALPKAEIPGILAAADMEIHDLQDYGIGIASLEAMAAGTPTIMATRPDYFMHTRLQDGVETLLVHTDDRVGLANAINRLIEDPDLAQRVGAGGRAWVWDSFDMPKICEHNLDVLSELASQKAT
jgi:glycosyltransferase involved in cell wall biosynthesis